MEVRESTRMPEGTKTLRHDIQGLRFESQATGSGCVGYFLLGSLVGRSLVTFKVF